MSRQSATRTQQQKPAATSLSSGLLQRKCVCGNRTQVGGDCEECGKKKRLSLQTKLKVNEPGDVFEQEADRIADQVLATPAHSGVSSAPPSIQLLSGQENGQADTVPVSVEQTLASPGKPLEPVLRQDMEQRFGHDFSRVRVHSGVVAEQSARDVNANAYTVGSNIVFGAGLNQQRSSFGRALVAHELAHTIQQSSLGSSMALQRAPAPQAEIEMPAEFAFSGDERNRKDKRYARSLGRRDAARIGKSGNLSSDDRQELNAKLDFFEGEAKQAYIQEIKRVLAQVTRKEIEMPVEYVGELPVAEAGDQARIKRRRERTIRFFEKVKDYQLQEAYVSRLQRYLDEGLEANEYWDVEMIEQIIRQRDPNAAWHAAARQEFLAKLQAKFQAQERKERLPTLPTYWQNQMVALSEQIRGLPQEAQELSRELLWKWLELSTQQHKTSEAIEEIIIDDLAAEYERALRAVDRAVQEDCRKKPTTWWQKWGNTLARFHGDPCKPWFGDDPYAHGYHELQWFKHRLHLRRDENGVPYNNVAYWVEDYLQKYRLLTDPKAQMEELQAQGLANMLAGGFGRAMPQGMPRPGGAGGARPPLKALPPASPTPKVLPPSSSVGAPGAVGDIVSSPVLTGPQRIVAIKPGGVEVMQPITRTPAPSRALPEPAKPTESTGIKVFDPRAGDAAQPAINPATPMSAEEVAAAYRAEGRIEPRAIRKELRINLEYRIKKLDDQIAELSAEKGKVQRELISINDELNAIERALKSTDDRGRLLARRQELLTRRNDLKSYEAKELGTTADLGIKKTEAKKLLGATEASYFDALSGAASKRKEYNVVKQGGKDEFFGTTGVLMEVDHVYPRSKIFLKPGFERLNWEQQIALFNYRPNLALIPKELNTIRGNMTYREFGKRSLSRYAKNESAIKNLSEIEAKAEADIDNMIKNPNLIQMPKGPE